MFFTQQLSLRFSGKKLSAAFFSRNGDRAVWLRQSGLFNIRLYLVAHPTARKWVSSPQWFTCDKERVNPLKKLGWTNPLTMRGMNHQVYIYNSNNYGLWYL